MLPTLSTSDWIMVLKFVVSVGSFVLEGFITFFAFKKYFGFVMHTFYVIIQGSRHLKTESTFRARISLSLKVILGLCLALLQMCFIIKYPIKNSIAKAASILDLPIMFGVNMTFVFLPRFEFELTVSAFCLMVFSHFRLVDIKCSGIVKFITTGSTPKWSLDFFFLFGFGFPLSTFFCRWSLFHDL